MVQKKSLSNLCGLSFVLLTLLPAISNAQLTPPEQEYVLRFADRSVVVAPDDPVFDLGQEFSISSWFFIEKYQDYRFILGRQNSVRHDPPAYELSTDFGADTNQQLRFMVGTKSITWKHPLDEWFHLAITLKADTARMFVNGSEVGKVDYSGTPTTQAVPFSIGMPVDENGEPLRGSGFTGMLRQVSLWNRALTPSEISQTATNHLQGNEQGLLAYWKMEEFPKKEVVDSGPNQLHLPINVELDGSQDNRYDPLWHLEEAIGNPYFRVHELPVYEILDIPDHLVFNHLLIDFNDDGLKDIVVINSDANDQPPYTSLPVHFLMNNGDFTFQDVSDQYDADAVCIFEFAVHDFDGDDKEDFVITCHGYDFDPFPGAPGGLFLSSENYSRAGSDRYPTPEEGFTHGLATGDVNNDGTIDVFEPNGGGNGNPFVLLLNDGEGNFEDHAKPYLPEIFYEGHRGGISAHVADINRDGFEDLIWGTSESSPEYEDLNQANALLLNDQQGKFIEQDGAFIKRLFNSQIGYTLHMETGDFNGDGLLDKFSSDFLGDYEYGSLRMHINNGDTTFTHDPDLVSSVSFDTQKSPVIMAAMETADFNGDGWLDVYAHANASGSYLLLNDGTGKLLETNTILTPKAFDGGRSMDIGDMNGDGRPDITQFLPAHNERSLLILENIRDYDSGATPFPLPSPPQLTRPADGESTNHKINFRWQEQTPHPYSDFQLATDQNFTDIAEKRDRYTGLSITIDSLNQNQTYYWRVRGENYTGEGEWSEVRSFTVGTAVSNEPELTRIPDEFALNQNYPNPFNPTTTITFALPEADLVRLEIYSMLGQKVTTLIDERRSAGTHRITFDASSLSSGLYIYQIQSGTFIQNRKMLLIK